MGAVAEIGPEDARRRLESGDGLYLDVRTVTEFVAGHAPGALNIPLAELNPRTGQMELNAVFLDVVRAHIPPDARVLVGCKAGGRSAKAAQILSENGYKSVVNIAGGFGGVTDPSGQIVCEGWSTLGFPVERGSGAERSYEALKGSLDQK